MQIFFTKLEEKIKEIEQLEKASTEDFVRKQRKNVTRAICAILALSDIARHEGLLALEEAANEMKLENYQEYLRDLIIYVVDGTDPEYVREMGYLKYFSYHMSDYEGLIFLIYLEGVLAIQQGENPRIIEEKLKCMLPRGYSFDFSEKEYSDFYETCGLKPKKKVDEDIVDRVINREVKLNPSDKLYFHAKIANHLLLEIDDRCVQRMLREIDNNELAVALKGMSPEARKKIFDNLSRRLSIMIAEDVEFIKYVRTSDVTTALHKILCIGMKLAASGEIIVPDEGVLKVFGEALADEIEFSKTASKKHYEVFDLAREYYRNMPDYI